jgi:lysophospholipase L1-like esterase
MSLPLFPLRALSRFAVFVFAGALLAVAASAQDKKPEEKKADDKKVEKKAEEPLDPVAKEAARVKSWEKQIAAFETEDAKKAIPAGATIFVGSSSIRMWKLADSFGDRAVYNRGFGGSQLADSVYYLDRLVLKHKPKVAVVYAGDNDLAGGKTPEKVVADFKALVEKFQASLPESKLIYIGIKPSIQRWKLIEKVRAANRDMQAFAAQSKNVVFVDVDKPMLGEDGQPKPELFLKDGLHMTAEGYKIWTALVLPHLEK